MGSTIQGGGMALITCYECGTQISELATSCPLCGAPAVVPAGAAVQGESVHAPEETTLKSWGWLRWAAYLIALSIVFKLFGVLLSCVLFAAIAIWNSTDASKPVPRILATIGVIFIGLLLWFGVRYWANSPTTSPTAAAEASPTIEDPFIASSNVSQPSNPAVAAQEIAPPPPAPLPIPPQSRPKDEVAPAVAQNSTTPMPRQRSEKRMQLCQDQYDRDVSTISESASIAETAELYSRYQSKEARCIARAQ